MQKEPKDKSNVTQATSHNTHSSNTSHISQGLFNELTARIWNEALDVTERKVQEYLRSGDLLTTVELHTIIRSLRK